MSKIICKNTVMLEEHDIQICLGVLRKRAIYNKKHHLSNNKISNESNQVVENRGIFGEYAYCVLRHTEFDFSGKYVYGKEDTVDEGFNIDVKTTKAENGNLMIRCSTVMENTDVFALMEEMFPISKDEKEFEYPTFKFIGYAYKFEVTAAPTKDPGNRGSQMYVINKEKLHTAGLKRTYRSTSVDEMSPEEIEMLNIFKK